MLTIPVIPEACCNQLGLLRAFWVSDEPCLKKLLRLTSAFTCMCTGPPRHAHAKCRKSQRKVTPEEKAVASENPACYPSVPQCGECEEAENKQTGKTRRVRRDGLWNQVSWVHAQHPPAGSCMTSGNSLKLILSLPSCKLGMTLISISHTSEK